MRGGAAGAAIVVVVALVCSVLVSVSTVGLRPIQERNALIERSVKKRGIGEFTIPGMMKITTVKKPARKARKGVPNPFKPGELMDIAAKPASTKVKVRALKNLKDMV